MSFLAVPTTTNQMDPEEKEKMEKRDWLAEKIQMLNTQLEGFEADVEKAVSLAWLLRAVVALLNMATFFKHLALHDPRCAVVSVRVDCSRI